MFIMNSIEKSGMSVNINAAVQSVTALEKSSTAVPTSPPATDEERAEFQKLLMQMNGDSKSHEAETSRSSNAKADKSDSFQIQTRHVKSVDDDHVSQKKSKKKRSGKKSNIPSPNDSPVKVTNTKESFSQKKKKRDQNQAKGQQSKSQGAAASSVIDTVAKLSLESQPESSKGSKSLQNPKVVKVLKTGTEKSDPSRPLAECSTDSHSKPEDSIKPSSIKNTGGSDVQQKSKVSMIPLRAAINLIKMKKKGPYPYSCAACDEDISDLERHLDKTKDRHLKKWKLAMRCRTLDLLPALSPKHLSLLDNLVQSEVECVRSTQEQLNIAHSIWQTLDSLAKQKFKDCSVRWFGSHACGIALSKNKILNMDLHVPNKDEAASTFLSFISALEEVYSDVERVVESNFTHANVNHQGMTVQLSLNNNGASNTAKLINDYISIDPRVKPLCIFFRYWGKLCGVDTGENGSWQGHAFPIMVIHFLQQIGVLPVLHDLVENREGDSQGDVYLDPKGLDGCWKGKNKDSPGSLLFKMFRFYATEHDFENHVVSITQMKPFLRKDTKWNAKRIAVIDPFQQKHNISRYISASMFDFVHSCLVNTACLLGIPRTEAGPLFGFIGPRPEPTLFEAFKCPDVLQEYFAIIDKVYDLVLRLDDSYNVPDLRDDNENQVPTLRADLHSSPVYRELFYNLRVVPQILHSSQPSKPSHLAYQYWWVTPYQAANLARHLSAEQALPFSKELCTDNEDPPAGCTSCHKSGHIRDNCPDEIIPKMSPVPKPSKELGTVLNDLCLIVFDSKRSEDEGLDSRMAVRDDLYVWLRRYYPDVDLQLFGSSLNGFGGRTSDIDMCLTFQSNANGEGLNFSSLVEDIEAALKGHQAVSQLVAITTAKVPIVKFAYGRSRIQVDISLYNRLGIMNTKLLHAYSLIDPRVRPIVYMMKNLAKTTGIGDASRGSLSSYAYSLMSLFFLQQVEPPVIPVLQELQDPIAGPQIETVDGANVYFFKNLEKLDEVWPFRNKNQSSLAELWLQLLEFYGSERFHKSQKVVCIRKKAPLYKFDKLWTSCNLCIEDPFDLNHNLGSGLSKRMNIFIVKTIQKAAKHFSSLPKGDTSLEDYYFNKNALSVGRPPSDRGCHICRSIGHLQNDCPQRQRYQTNQRPMGRPNRVNQPRQNQGYENFNRGGIRREQGRDNHPRNHDARISNMPMPLIVPHHHNTAMAMNQQNHRPMNIHNRIPVGNTKPPGFASIPPGFPLYGPPPRLVAPQMSAVIMPSMPQRMQGPGPQVVFNARPSVRPWQ